MEDIEAVLEANHSLSYAQKASLRQFARATKITVASKALQLLRAYSERCGVSERDVSLLEAAADRTDDPHMAADALSLLCNWLDRGQQEVHRLLRASASSTGGGDYLCITACSLVGSILSQQRDATLAKAVADVLHDDQRPRGTREAARDALLIASGMSSREIVHAEMAGAADLWTRADAAAASLLLQLSIRSG